MKLELHIDSLLPEVEVTVRAPARTPEVDALLDRLAAEDAPLLGAQTAAEPVRAGDCLPLALHACADAGAELPLYAGTQGEAFLCRINGRVCVCAAVSGDVPPPGLTRLMRTDAGTMFMHEAYHKDDDRKFTRHWFAWANTLFGELILHLLDEGKDDLINSLPEK